MIDIKKLINGDFEGFKKELKAAFIKDVNATDNELHQSLQELADGKNTSTLNAFVQTLSTSIATEVKAQVDAVIEQVKIAATEDIAKLQGEIKALSDKQENYITKDAHTAATKQIEANVGAELTKTKTAVMGMVKGEQGDGAQLEGHRGTQGNDGKKPMVLGWFDPVVVKNN